MEESSENISSEHGVREKPFACWIICDTEATGLKRRPRVTELCMLAVLTDELMSTTRPMPRVANKLQLCFNPESFIEPHVSRMTGLYNDILEQMGTFKDQASLITGFMASLPQPVCLIAHSGHRFDFPLLQSELGKADCSSHAQLYCADSLEAFRVLDGLPAIPDWVLQREKEEKLRKAQACDDSLNPCKVNSNETGSSVIITVRSPSESTHREDAPSKTASETTSPNKRQVSSVDGSGSTDDPASLPKLLKVDSAPPLGSQSSVGDFDLVQAYDAAIAEINAGDVNGAVMPGHAEADRSLQSAQETTPEKDPSWTSSSSVPGPVVKRPPPPVCVRSAQREKVSRRLFVEEADTVDKESLHGHVKNDSRQQNIAEQCQTAENTSASVHSCQGSLSDEQIVQAVAGVASLMPLNSGAGGDPITEGKNAQTNQYLGLGEQQQQSCLQDQAETACDGNKDTSPVKTDLSALSTQNQIPDVTSSSATVPTQPMNKTSPNAASSSSTTPKVSYKLQEIYRRQFGQCPDSTHCAEDDCLSLLKVIMTKKSEFMAYVEKHAVRFDGVQPMY